MTTQRNLRLLASTLFIFGMGTACTETGFTANTTTTAQQVDLPPSAKDDGPYEGSSETPMKIAPAELLKNDTGPNLTISSVQGPSRGQVALAGGFVIYTPEAGVETSATFSYTVRTPAGLSASAKVSLNLRKPAPEKIYMHTPSTIYTQDRTTFAAVKVKDLDRTNFFDIAINNAGVMFGVSLGQLYHINTDTGVTTLVPVPGTAALGNINALTFLSDGRLVLGGNGVRIYDFTTQQTTTLVPNGVYTSSGDIIALPDFYLYWTVYSPAGEDRLIQVDPKTGATRDLGPCGGTGVYGLGFADGILYGYTGGGQILEIDPLTARGAPKASSGLPWYGATTNPIFWVQ